VELVHSGKFPGEIGDELGIDFDGMQIIGTGQEMAGKSGSAGANFNYAFGVLTAGGYGQLLQNGLLNQKVLTKLRRQA
jgi:hypothetical protein